MGKKRLELFMKAIKYMASAILLFDSAYGQFQSKDSVAIEFLPEAEMITKAITFILPGSNNNNRFFYIGTDGEGVFQFMENKWHCLNGGLNSENAKKINSMSWIKRNSNNTLLLATKSGLFRSTDGGAHWQLTRLQNEIICLSRIIGDSSSALAGTKNGLYQIQEDIDSCKIRFLGLNGKTISSASGAIRKKGELFVYAVVDSEIFGNIAYEKGWQKLNIKQANNKVHIVALDNISPNKLYIGTHQGVIRTVSGDTNLNILAKSDDNFSYWRVDKLISNPYLKNNIYGIFFNAAAQIHKIGHSDDAAESWQEVKIAANLEREKFTAISVLDKYATLIMGTYNGKLLCKREFIDDKKEKRCYSIFWKGRRRYATISLATFLLTWAACDLINCNKKSDFFVPEKLPDPWPIAKIAF